VELPFIQRKQLLSGFDLFCSGLCLISKLVAEGEEDNKRIAAERRVYPSQMNAPFDYYCNFLRRSFRSKSEAVVASFLFLHNIQWKYEPYAIALEGNKSYTPDFWLENFSFFVEVKGLWAGSAKKKMKIVTAMGIKLILVPDYLVNKLAGEINYNKISRPYYKHGS